MLTRLQVAYQGAPGAFAEEACRAFLPEWEPMPMPSFAGVAEAVIAGAVGRGMLPLRNVTAGEVPGIEPLIRDKGLRLVSCHVLPVRIHLLACPGTRREAIRIVASHRMALAQCRNWLRSSGLETEEADNTALAALALAEAGDPARAVLASSAAAKAHGLAILELDVHDRPDNATTFGVIAAVAGDGA